MQDWPFQKEYVVGYGMIAGMRKRRYELVFVNLCYVLLPALLVHIDGTFGTVIDTDPGFLATDGTFHDLLPPLSFFPDPEGTGPFPLSSRESVT